MSPTERLPLPLSGSVRDYHSQCPDPTHIPFLFPTGHQPSSLLET